MSASVAILDTGSGNLRSVEKAFVQVGGNPTITADPDQLRRSDRVVVPGQGAFHEFAMQVRTRGLDTALQEVIASGTPFLGICLGLQVLFDESEERAPQLATANDNTASRADNASVQGASEDSITDVAAQSSPSIGLGLVRGRVVRFRPSDKAMKVPHMGWNRVCRASTEVRDPILEGIADGTYFYFVHSFYVTPADAAIVALTCEYDGAFAAAVRKDNVFACQFHPEKSQRAGLRLLANFLESP